MELTAPVAEVWDLVGDHRRRPEYSAGIESVDVAADGGARTCRFRATDETPSVDLTERFEGAGLPVLGDDLASQFGASVVHHALLQLLQERGLTVVRSCQVNLGGTEAFRNLVKNPSTKKQSTLDAQGSDKVQTAPLG